MKTANDPRHLGRQFALQILFACAANQRASQQTSQTNVFQNLAKFRQHWQADKLSDSDKREPNWELSQAIMETVVRKTEEFDLLISEAAPEWPLNQISLVDLTILRIALAELTQEDPPPHKVVIDEAVELAKEFGGENSSKFVNGVLGTIVEKLEIEVETEQENNQVAEQSAPKIVEH